MNIDLANPEYFSGPKATTEQVHVVQPPPQDQEHVMSIAAVLLAGYSIQRAAKMLADLLAPLGITMAAILPALGLAQSGTKAKARARLAPNGLTKRADSLTVIRDQELYYRAAYLLNASYRIQKKINAGEPVRTALADESLYYRQHEAAKRGRLDAAAKAQRASAQFGPLLGWYLNPLLNNEIECITANGHNFDPLRGTIIGFPGAVHLNCGCYAGPPFEGKGLVDEALRGIVIRGTGKRIVRLRKTG